MLTLYLRLWETHRIVWTCCWQRMQQKNTFFSWDESKIQLTPEALRLHWLCIYSNIKLNGALEDLSDPLQSQLANRFYPASSNISSLFLFSFHQILVIRTPAYWKENLKHVRHKYAQWWNHIGIGSASSVCVYLSPFSLPPTFVLWVFALVDVWCRFSLNSKAPYTTFTHISIHTYRKRHSGLVVQEQEGVWGLVFFVISIG